MPSVNLVTGILVVIAILLVLFVRKYFRIKVSTGEQIASLNNEHGNDQKEPCQCDSCKIVRENNITIPNELTFINELAKIKFHEHKVYVDAELYGDITKERIIELRSIVFTAFEKVIKENTKIDLAAINLTTMEKE